MTTPSPFRATRTSTRGTATRACGHRPAARRRLEDATSTTHLRPGGRRYVAAALLLMAALAADATTVEAQSSLTEHTLRLDSGRSSPPARIDEFSFLEGGWSGEGLGGEADEVWSQPAAGTMVGAFRLIREGEVVFYEIYALEEHESTVVLRLKHFDPGPGLPGWEERDEETTFRLVRVEPNRAWFHGLTLHLRAPDELVVHLALRAGDAPIREEAFRFRRRGADGGGAMGAGG